MTSLLFALFMQVQVRVTVPAVRFEAAPPMVEVQPGVMVVHDSDQEVFFADGRYWTRGVDGRWYRANDHRGGWAVAEPRAVPPRIVGLPPGQYRHYKGKPEKFRVANSEVQVIPKPVPYLRLLDVLGRVCSHKSAAV